MHGPADLWSPVLFQHLPTTTTQETHAHKKNTCTCKSGKLFRDNVGEWSSFHMNNCFNETMTRPSLLIRKEGHKSNFQSLGIAGIKC